MFPLRQQLPHQNKNETMLNITNHNPRQRQRHRLQLLQHSNTNSNRNMNMNTWNSNTKSNRNMNMNTWNSNRNSNRNMNMNTWNSNTNSNCYLPQSVPPSGQLQNYNRHSQLYRQAQMQTQLQMKMKMQTQMKMQTPQETVSMFSSSWGGSGLKTPTTYNDITTTSYSSCSIPPNNGMETTRATTSLTSTTSTINFTDQQQRYLHLFNNLNYNAGGPSHILEEVVLCLRDAAAPMSTSMSTATAIGTAAPIYSHNHNNSESASSSSLLQLLLLSNLNLNLNQKHLFATKAAESLIPTKSNGCTYPGVDRNNKRGREWESESVVGPLKVRFPSYHCSSSSSSNSHSNYRIPNRQRFHGLTPLLFSPLMSPDDSPPPLDGGDADADGNSDAAKNKRHKPNPLTSSISSSSTSKSTSKSTFTFRSTSQSISRAIRRRLQSLTHGTRLVPRKLPSIVIGSRSGGGSSNNRNSNNNIKNNSNADDEKDETTNAPSGWGRDSLVLPAHIPRVWNSQLLQNSDENEQLTSQQQVFLRTHALLGKGSFATVESVTVESSIIDSSIASEEEGNYYYACKSTRDDLFMRGMTNHRNTYINSNENENSNANSNANTNTNETTRKNRRVYIQAESQLAYEAHILGSLDHPNIVRLMGFFKISTSSANNNNNNNTSSVLIVPPMDVTLPERSVLLTEVLEETLGQKLSRWRKATTTDTFGSRQKRNRTLEKLSICQQLADAMEHIHFHNIAYRDLKPENVGFLGATLKLFDFGLSREMTAEGKHDDPTISMGVDSKTPSSSPSLSSSLRTLTPTPSSSLSLSSSLSSSSSSVIVTIAGKNWHHAVHGPGGLSRQALRLRLRPVFLFHFVLGGMDAQDPLSFSHTGRL